MNKEEQKKLITEIMNEDAKDDIRQLAEQSWECCDGCDKNDKNFWIGGFIKGYIQAKENEILNDQNQISNIPIGEVIGKKPIPRNKKER